jgi:glycosyltransferase involved in cell wall biosynthesis
LNSSASKGPERARLRVAIVSRLDQPGGNQSVVLSLIRGLNAAGILPDIAWDTPPNPAMLHDHQARAGFSRLPLRVSTRFLDRIPITARYILRAANLVSEQDLPAPFDFYYIFYNGFLIRGSAPHLRYLHGPPLLPQLDLVSPGLRGIPYRLLRGVYRILLRRRFPVYEFHNTDRYVINSYYTASLFEEAHGVRLPVLHPPIDLSGRSYRPGDLPDRDTITFFSRFADYKRPEMVLALAARYSDRRFVLMGGVKPAFQTYYHSLQQRAKQAGLGNVEFVANPTNDRIKEELGRTLVYVFPGINEHFGMTTAEAAASGAIPFVHDSGGQREIVPDFRLRFTDDCFHQRFDDLIRLPALELMALQSSTSQHVQQFSEAAFIEKMLAYLPGNGK